MDSTLRQTWETLRRQIQPLIGLVAAIHGPLIAIGILLKTLPVGDQASSEKFSEIAESLLSLVAIPLLNAAVLHLAHADRERRLLGAWTALRSGMVCWFPLVVGYIAISFVVFGWMLVGLVPGFVLLHFLGNDKTYYLLPCLVPAIYMAARYGFMETLIVVRGRDPYAARQESMRLSQGHHTRMFLAGVFLIGLPLALEQFASTLGGMLAPAGLPAILTGAAIEFTSGLLNLVYLVFFFHWYSQLEQQKDAK